MFDAVRTIARFTFYEALHNRLFAMLVVGMICILGLVEFVGELAITEADNMQAVFIAAGMRLFAVVIVALFVITSVSREFSDKGFELILSLPIKRSAYYFGKLTGFYLLSLALVIAAALLLSIYAETAAVLLWSLSLACELMLVIALSLLCLFTFSNITMAFVTIMSFYLLSRGMHNIQLLSHSPILESQGYAQEFMRLMIDAIALVLPDLHHFTQSEWLIHQAKWHHISPVIIQTMIYFSLLSAAGLFDLYRKNL